MQYHYQIISSFDPTDIPVDSRNLPAPANEGFECFDTADMVGEFSLKVHNYNPDQYYVRVCFVPENIEEEDILQGHPYPGHECWDD